MTTLTVATLTETTIEGNGVFDVLMRATKAHLDVEYSKNRIKGPEYSTVYLGALQAVMQTALQFSLVQEKTNRELLLLDKPKHLLLMLLMIFNLMMLFLCYY